MVQDRVIFEEKLKRGLVPDGDGGWITIEAAILKEKSRHRQSRLWDPGVATLNKEKEDTVEKEESENLFFEKSNDEKEEELLQNEELLISDPVEDTAEVDLLYDEDEDTAIHELEEKAPDTTIIEVVEEPDYLSASNETDTVALDRSEVMKDIDLSETSTSDLDGLADDFGDIIDSFAASDEIHQNVENISEAPTVEVDIAELKEDLPVKITDEDIELPPSSDNSEELILDIPDEISTTQSKDNAITDDSIDEWEQKSGSLLSKILIPAVLLISAAVLVAVILIVT